MHTEQELKIIARGRMFPKNSTLSKILNVQKLTKTLIIFIHMGIQGNHMSP